MMISRGLNPLLIGTDVPPIPAAQGWTERYDGRHGALINLAQAIPGSPPPVELLQRLQEAAGDPASAAYGPILGDEPLRTAFARDLGLLYDADVGPEEIGITPGCNHAFMVAVMGLARAGDEIILPAPWYFNHKMTLDMLGIHVRPLACKAEHGFVPQPVDAEALIGPRTRAIVLVTPNNPTGAIYPADVLEEFARLARDTGVRLILDETYRDFLPEGETCPHQLFATPDWRNYLIHLYSFSKSYAIPGHRLGALVAGAETMAEIGKVLDCSQICAPRAAQAAVAWGIAGIEGWRRATRSQVNAQAGLFRRVIEDSPRWSIAAIGAYFAYIRHPFEATGQAVAERLAAEVGVLTLPGSFFGPGQEPYLRVAFANVDPARLSLVAERFSALR